MKRLFVMRHAKSSWKDLTLDDFDRPLNKRAKKDVPFMAQIFKDRVLKIDLILSSPARRAKSTAKQVAKVLEYKSKILYKDEIYEASSQTLNKLLKNLDDKHSVVCLFGHNPGLNDLLEKYVGFEENLPTSGVVEIEFQCESWRELSDKNATLKSFDYPKKYMK
jgi:phosphohistidine phosphatase